LTAESLRAEVYSLWARGDMGLNSLLLITHLIDEAVFLADRIVILGANPGSIREVVSNPLPHPRHYRSPNFLSLVDQIHAVVTQIHLPDEAPAAAAEPERPRLEPIPPAHVLEIVGLLEVVHNRGDRSNIFELSTRLRIELGHVILAVKAAELLDLVDTPKQEVVLTPIGREFVSGDANARKRIFHRQLRLIPTFAFLVDRLQHAPGMRLPAEIVQEDLAMHLPNEPVQTLFDTVVGWGRYGELLGYDPDAQEVYLDVESTAGSLIEERPPSPSSASLSADKEP